MIKAAVVILNFNGSALLRKFLPGVVAHSAPFEVIVADNGSTDGSGDLIAKEFPSVRLIRIPTNLGFCGGYNHALKQVDAEYLVLLNSDVEVTPGWLGPLLHTLDTNSAIASVQPKILSQAKKTLFEYAGAGGGFIDSLGYPFCRGRLFYSIETDEHQYDGEAGIFWSSGACMMIRSKLFHNLGGFDEDFFAHMEEIDLCWRLQRAGHRIHYNGASTVYHVGGGTLSANNPRKTYLNFKNGLSLLYKNLPAAELVYKFPVRIMLDWIASITFGISGSWPDARSVLKAHAHFFASWRREHKRRMATSSLGFRRPVTQYGGLIVWQFFILGKRKYSELKT
ncbi:MAG TPA: glycosyltransferase family 2 protein [Cyclobacteriaceae bacterium]|nr:glycosyltransferase family 2 protein [Cyclobacteriaceae bacterium]